MMQYQPYSVVDCPVCRHIPPFARASYKSGETLENTIPAQAEELVVIGAPFYQRSTVNSNTCWVKCPHCAAVYRWTYAYEYLVNGSEEQFELERLGLEEGLQARRLCCLRLTPTASGSPARLRSNSRPYAPEGRAAGASVRPQIFSTGRGPLAGWTSHPG